MNNDIHFLLFAIIPVRKYLFKKKNLKEIYYDNKGFRKN